MSSLAHAASLGSLTPSPRPALRLVTSERPRLVPGRQSQTVLVGDGDVAILELLSFHLGSSFDVLGAGDGEEALRMALVCQPDVVVLDVRMPKLNGYEVTRLIRQHETTRETPVILLDTRPERIDTLRGFAVGADDYLTKPLDPARLLARISEALER
jgi:DNA-binding response OmpR family regulator